MAKPEGVRIVRADGTELNCELIHLGPDKDGLDCWGVAGAHFFPDRGDKLRVAVFPARTALEILGEVENEDMEWNISCDGEQEPEGTS